MSNVLFQAIQFRWQKLPFKIIQFSISTQFKCRTDLFQAILFSISTQFRSIWPIERTLSSANNPGLSWPGSDGNEGVHRILQSSTITEASPSDFLVSYPRNSWECLSPLRICSRCILLPKPTRLSLLYWEGGLTPCREAVDVFYSPSVDWASWLFKVSLTQEYYIYVFWASVLNKWLTLVGCSLQDINFCWLFNIEFYLHIYSRYRSFVNE